MKKYVRICWILLAALLAAGCSAKGETDWKTVDVYGEEAQASVQDDQNDRSERAEGIGATVTEDCDPAGEEKPEYRVGSGEKPHLLASQNSQTAPDILTQAPEEEPEEEEIELTAREIRKLTASLTASDMNFFSCLYNRPEEIDWDSVLYNGGGIAIELNETQMTQLEAMWQQEEQEMPPVTAVRQKDFNALVLAKTGLDYSDARKPLSWAELGRGILYSLHEASEEAQIEFLSGTVCGDIYKLYYRKNGETPRKEPGYVVTAQIVKKKWKFISNLSLKQTPPVTMLDLEFFATREEALACGAVQEFESSGRDDGQQENWYYAVMTACESDTRVRVQKAYEADELSSRALQEGVFIPGETFCDVVLSQGEKIMIPVDFQWVPYMRVTAVREEYYGEYCFGEENWLHRETEQGLPENSYVIGHDLDSEGRGTAYTSQSQMFNYLDGVWMYYDGILGEYTAMIRFDGGYRMQIITADQTYDLNITGYKRKNADKTQAPDVLTFGCWDEEVLAMIRQQFPFKADAMGEYMIYTEQIDGQQTLMLAQINSGEGCLTYLLPEIAEYTDRFVFCRFIGPMKEESNGSKKEELKG